MATVVLQVAGAAIGGAIGGPFGAVLGRAAGAAAGYAIDQQLFQKDKKVVGPRLEASRFLSSSEGAPIPKAYGRLQLGGEIIWATRFEEIASTQKTGGKGGPKTQVTEYSYFANFAVAICEGPISAIQRIWADGKEIDQTKINLRRYLGSETQSVDPLVEALQGAGNCPAYRGMAYVVFEDFPLADFGNRIPQLSFEVLRSLGGVEDDIKSVCVIPGSTGYGYSPNLQLDELPGGVTKNHNRHTLIRTSDWKTSIDELQAICPNLEQVCLVVTWYGTDLRAGNCEVKPGVEFTDFNAQNNPWIVSGIAPPAAHLISKIDGKPAFGSTPSDHSVIEAISDLHARGLKVTFYPFIMMDIPSGNSLPNPFGGIGQPVYPWRGRVTCDPAIGETSSADKTTAARNQIDMFCGTTIASDYIASGNSIQFTGTLQWTFRRMILHYAHLCELAGGAENFIIGSEMVGLSPVRDQANNFPFVDQLMALSGDVKSIVNANTKITYAADWSEYFGYQPGDGSNDRYFHLDPLWANANIDSIGIDNYMPISDWRNEGDPVDVTAEEYSVEYMSANIAAGEGYDWYYASAADRLSGNRTPINDGQGEPWIWRYKDLVSWWSNAHHQRVNGVRSASSTPWVPKSKPIWFTEIGCPAINKGPNQPNVFYDPKSSQSEIPYFSSAGRDDLIQRRFVKSHLDYWSGKSSDINAVNPSSNQYAGRMLDLSQISWWAWDARPFPAFPNFLEIWSDGGNWQTGHWLNGRIGGCPLDELVAKILSDYGFYDYSTDRLSGWVDGYALPIPMSARSVLEPLLGLFGANVTARNGVLEFSSPIGKAQTAICFDDLVELENQPIAIRTSAQDTDMPREVIIHHAEVNKAIDICASKSRRLETESQRQIQFDIPAVFPRNYAIALGDERLREAWTGREAMFIKIAPQEFKYIPGDTLNIDNGEYLGNWQIVSIEDAEFRNLELKKVQSRATQSFSIDAGASEGFSATEFGTPLAVFLDIPRNISAIDHPPQLFTAINSIPWGNRYNLASSADDTGFQIRSTTSRRATTGSLIEALPSGPEFRWDYANTIRISLQYGSLSSATELALLNGANRLAVQCDNGNWELLQFMNAQVEGDGTWSLSKLLRAQLGTEIPMFDGASTGNQVILLDEQVEAVSLENHERHLALQWRVGPAIDVISSDSYLQQEFTFNDQAAKPFSPVHLSVEKQASGALNISWRRRTRLLGDDWQITEVPLGEHAENYQLKIYDGSNVLREIYSTQTFFDYELAEQLSDFGAAPNNIEFGVSQLNATGDTGSERRAEISIT